MLRASSEIEGTPVDVRAVRDDGAAEDSGVPHAVALLAWCDATIGGTPQAITLIRERVTEEMGAAAAVDVAAIMANFERMTRIADATGIPVDTPVNALASDIQDELGLREFRSSANTAAAGMITKTAARLLSPLVLRLMPMVATRVKAKMRARR